MHAYRALVSVLQDQDMEDAEQLLFSSLTLASAWMHSPFEEGASCLNLAWGGYSSWPAPGTELIGVLLWLSCVFVSVLCESTTEGSSWLGLPLPYSVPVNNAEMKTYSTNYVSSLPTGYCRCKGFFQVFFTVICWNWARDGLSQNM